MNSVYLSLINLCVHSLSGSLSVSIVIWFPLRNVRNKCECTHTMRVDMVLVVKPYVHHIYGDKHISVREEIKISLPNLSEGGSLRLPISTTSDIPFKDRHWPRHSQSEERLGKDHQPYKSQAIGS